MSAPQLDQARTGPSPERALGVHGCPAPSIQAVAIEALQGLSLPREELAKILTGISIGGDLILAATVNLGLLSVDPEEGCRRLVLLLRHRDELARFDGIHALRYMPGEAALKALISVIQKEPSPALRGDTFASLERHLDAPEIVPVLLARMSSLAGDRWTR